jgi:recombination protein RecA
VLTAKSALEQGFTPVLIDTEGGISKEFAARWGLDVGKCLYNYTPWAEEIKGVLAQVKEQDGRKYCIIIDSIGGIDKMKSYDDAIKGEYKQDMGGNARIIKSILKLLVNIIKAQNSIGVITSHFYSQSGGVPMPDSVVGGKALMLLPDIILYLKKASKTDTNKIDTDKKVNVFSIKNRFYPTDKIGAVNIDYMNGIDRFAGVFELALEMEVIDQKGAWFSYKEERLAQGMSNSVEFVLDNPNIKKLILDDVNEQLKTT